MEMINEMVAPGCGYSCIGICVGMCFMPPFYMVAISDDVAWSCVISNAQ